MTTAGAQIREELQSFATALLERRGGLVDWAAGTPEGTAIVPDDVAAALEVAGEFGAADHGAQPARLVREPGRRFPGDGRPRAANGASAGRFRSGRPLLEARHLGRGRTARFRVA